MAIRPGRRLSICLMLLIIGTLGTFVAAADEVLEPLGTPRPVRFVDTVDGLEALGEPGAGSSPRLDPSFGAGGLVTIGWPPEDPFSTLSALLVQPDGRILLGGNSESGARLVRYLVDGTLDPAFGESGILTFSLDGSRGNASALALLPDGKILVGGSFVPTPSSAWRFVARLNPDGTFDPAFGAGGYIEFGQPGIGQGISSLALQPDGKILVGGHLDQGFLLGRLQEHGEVDPGFGNAGIVTTPFPNGVDPTAKAIFLQAGGKIVVGGSLSQQALARYESDGSLDPSFGDGGIVNADLFSDTRWLGRQPDGKILVGGIGGNNRGAVMMVARFDSDGALDAAYGQDGVGEAGFDPLFGAATIGTVMPDGKVLAVGEAARKRSLSNSTVALTGLQSDGNRDHGFQKDTGMLLPFLGTQYTAMAVQPDGRILAAGYGRLPDQTWHWFVIRFVLKRSPIVVQEPL